jgi:hypothetical protein
MHQVKIKVVDKVKKEGQVVVVHQEVEIVVAIGELVGMTGAEIVLLVEALQDREVVLTEAQEIN